MTGLIYILVVLATIVFTAAASSVTCSSPQDADTVYPLATPPAPDLRYAQHHKPIRQSLNQGFTQHWFRLFQHPTGPARRPK